MTIKVGTVSADYLVREQYQPKENWYWFYHDKSEPAKETSKPPTHATQFTKRELMQMVKYGSFEQELKDKIERLLCDE